MKPILIIEGVTGAGKSSVIGALGVSLPRGAELIIEDETLGELMDQVRDPAWRARPRFDALEAVLERIERRADEAPGAAFLVERFHLTAYALFPEWERLDAFDARLAALGACVVLLSFPRADAEPRAIERRDRPEWAEGMDAWYGSRAAALAAVRSSQELRWDALTKTRLPFLHIDTRDQEWSRYARTIRAYWEPG